jgi:hypothetical protein
MLMRRRLQLMRAAMVGGTAHYAGKKVQEGCEEDAYRGEQIAEGTTAAVALIEPRWAIPLRDTVQAEGGIALAAEWIHPADLVAIGLAAAEKDAASVKA